MNFRIGSRQSALAQIQAYQVGKVIKAKFKNSNVSFQFRESLGDKNLHDPLWKLPEKGVFTEDFHQDLVSGAVDLIVHSWKDLPTQEKPETCIAATLPRADSRDLLLFKKTEKNQKQKNLTFLSSSPRREYNLSRFFLEFFPWKLESIKFKPVRGNVQTRIRKLLEDPDAQGLIVAKAALDRLLLAHDLPVSFAKEQSEILGYLEKLTFSILPLSLNPGAAAQGALAIEVLRSRKDLISMLNEINHEDTFNEVTREREILAETGGGCHQKLGISATKKEFGMILSVRGLLDSKGPVDTLEIENSMSPMKKFKKNEALVINSAFVGATREDCKLTVPTTANALMVAKLQAWTPIIEEHHRKFEPIIWCSGMNTWKSLNDRGVWVHGCDEGLGSGVGLNINHIVGQKLNWFKLTHDKALRTSNDLGSYGLKFDFDWQKLKLFKAFFWSAAVFFEEAVKAIPEHLLSPEVEHFCGPGLTFETLSHKVKPAVCLNEKDWLKHWVEGES